MELRQLTYFAALCKARNFTLASQNLNVSQPSVTKAIQQLESELGVRLVERSQKPLGLTREGEVFYAHVERILQELDQAVEEVRPKKKAVKLPISVGLSPFTGVILERILSHPDAMKQGVFFNLVRRSATDLIAQLMDRELDLSLMINYHLPPELEFILLERQEVLLVLPPDHPLQFKEEITFEDLREYPPATLLSTPNAILTQVILDRYREVGFEPKPDPNARQYHPDKQMSIEWVRNGLGPAFSPEHALEDVTDLPIVSVTPPVMIQVGLAYRRGSKLSAGTRRLMEYIQEEYPKYIHSTHRP